MEIHMTRLYISPRKYIYIFFCFILLGLPTKLIAECQVTLEWAPNGADPEGYRLYERQSDEAYDDNHYYDVGKESSCTVHSMEENKTYNFVVRAYSGAEESEDSNEATYLCTASSASNDTIPPSQPTTVSPLDTAQNVGLEPILTTSEFHDPDPENTHAQTRWQIYRLDNDECVYDVISNSELTTVGIPSSILEPFTTYYWTVTYYSQSGGVSEPSPSSDFTTSNEVDSTASLGDIVGGGGGGSSNGLGVGCFIQTLF